MRALDPVLQMSEQVNQALQAFDRVNSVQRQSLEQLGQELTSQATAAMETRAASMDQTLQALASQVQSLKTTMASMLASSQRLQALPQALDSAARAAAEQMRSSSRELASQAERVRPSPWVTLGQTLGAAILGALLVAAGQAVLNKPAPASAEIQQRADQLSQLVRKSTPKERELLNQIVSRPEK
jgi:seryl-tRNA synthetase